VIGIGFKKETESPSLWRRKSASFAKFWGLRRLELDLD